MLTRQQRRADQRARAKVKTINATPLVLGMMTALHPTLWQRQPEPVQSIAINCSDPAPSVAQVPDSSKAGGAVAEAKTEPEKIRRGPQIKARIKTAPGTAPLDIPDKHKHCDSCGQYLKHSLFKRDPHGLFGISDTCHVCTTVQAIENGELRIVSPHAEAGAKVLNAWEQIETPTEPPIREDRREPSGWPMNPFTYRGTRTPAVSDALRDTECMHMA